MNKLNSQLNSLNNSREKLYIKHELYTDKLHNLQQLFLNKSQHQKEYYETFIKNKNLIDKRKFLSLLLLIATNLSLDELLRLTVEDFLKIINKINEQLNNYEKLPKYEETVNEFYLLIDEYNFKLKLNPAFKRFFKEGLYNDFIKYKSKEDPVLSSVMNNKPLIAANLKKDLNEEIVELI